MRNTFTNIVLCSILTSILIIGSGEVKAFFIDYDINIIENKTEETKDISLENLEFINNNVLQKHKPGSNTYIEISNIESIGTATLSKEFFIANKSPLFILYCRLKIQP